MQNKIGEKIRQLRLLNGLSQEDVAEEIGMSHGNFGKIERGEIDVNSTHLVAIAKILKVNVSDFFEHKNKPIVNEPKGEYGYATKAELSDIVLAIERLTKIVEKLQDKNSEKKENQKKGYGEKK